MRGIKETGRVMGQSDRRQEQENRGRGVGQKRHRMKGKRNQVEGSWETLPKQRPDECKSR